MTTVRPHTTCVNRAYRGVAEMQSQQHNPKEALEADAVLHIYCYLIKSDQGRNRGKRTGEHTSVCIRSIAAHVNRSNSVRIRLQIRDRSAGGAQKHTNRSPPQPGHRLSGTRPQQRPELSTAARHVGSVTRRHRNSHTKQRRVRRTSFYTCLPNPYTPKKLRRARGPPTLR